MTKHLYDRSLAERLIPLLRSITREIRERTTAIERLDLLLDAPASAQLLARQHELTARLVEHRRALRNAERELSGLGCILDEDHPLRVLIPGDDGEFDGGYAFDALSGSLESITLVGVR
jgi:hypothetical protein